MHSASASPSQPDCTDDAFYRPHPLTHPRTRPRAEIRWRGRGGRGGSSRIVGVPPSVRWIAHRLAMSRRTQRPSNTVWGTLNQGPGQRHWAGAHHLAGPPKRSRVPSDQIRDSLNQGAFICPYVCVYVFVYMHKHVFVHLWVGIPRVSTHLSRHICIHAKMYRIYLCVYI